MKSRKVDCILLPCPEDLPVTPSVSIGEKITRAIELMISQNLNRIAVVRDKRPIGMVRLEDAFKEVGLEMPVKS
jgi:CBS domain-containing protein